MAKADIWTQTIEGSGVFLCPYTAPSFGPANSLLVQYKDDRAAIVSCPIAPSPALIEAARASAPVDALIVPNIGHRGGLPAWRDALPGAGIYAPDDCLEMLARLVPDADLLPVSRLPVRSGLRILCAPGTRTGSLMLESRLGPRPVVYLDEILTTMTGRPSSMLNAALFALFGVKRGLSVNRVFTGLLTRDRAALAQTALGLLEGDPVCIPAHGEPLTDEADLKRARALLRPLAGR